MAPLKNRYDFVLFYDVENGNPNGDPDAGNMPRIDVETGHGLVTDVCIKRKIRNFVDLIKGNETGYRIYVRDGAVLNTLNQESYTALGKDAKEEDLTSWMCDNFYDVRTFGAVMSTGVNCGQVRGPVQLTFSRSQSPIVPMEVSITRVAVTRENDKDKGHTMGRKYIVPYGLYRMEGFVSAPLAQRTGFSQEDMELLIQSMLQMFEHDRSAARGKMDTRKLVVFRHDSEFGNAPARMLFDMVKCRQKDENRPPRAFDDYEIYVDGEMPKGVTMIENGI